TLYNGYTDTIEKMLERLRLDLKYLDNYSLFTDVKIIFLTAFSIIFGKKF
ncbi:MAG: sugar transferase, partial [Porphyromonadaceae bacterium]|nr:sugar transferase [Porphyromonadaceae bacterium]